ncbi:unnamed protein product [Soboliphyme baturini]|uniref:Tyrosine-protein phosphatase domain-containing protein n=1 Tax=Soboliphyme baturini TaxID=241478 RepID=A0A183IU77_9BILA|nr:unnamed protein product [Soboliphyme baturini]
MTQMASSLDLPKRALKKFERKRQQSLAKLTFVLSEITVSNKSNLQDLEAKICNMINVKVWPVQHRVPYSTSGFIDVIKMARSWRRRAPDRADIKPTIVISHNGVSRCGIFIAMNILIDQINMEKQVDVFHAAKMIRLNRPQLFDNKEEYKYLYDLLLQYYITSPEYQEQMAAENETIANHV